jgi:exoribonuclease-2
MIRKNALVLYKQEPAIVTEVDDKITIQYRPHKSDKVESQRVREKDIFVLALDAPSLKDVHAFQAKFVAQGALTTARLAEAHELLAEDAPSAMSVQEIAGIAFGAWNAENAWAYYSAVKASPCFALAPEAPPSMPAFIPRTREEASEVRSRQAAKAEDGEKRQEFMERLKKRVLNLPDDGHFMQEVEAVALGQSAKSRIMGEAHIAVEGPKAHRLLLDTGVWTRYKNPYPARRGLSSRSANECLGKPPEEERLRLNHAALAIYNDWTADPDDAVFFDGEALWVHIADPASTVTPDSAVDLAARNRGATLYLPEGAARMLAEESLEDFALGLAPLSRALSFKIPLTGIGSITGRLDDDGPFGLGECEVYKTLVEVRRFTYAEAEAKRKEADFAPLFAIAQKNLARRNFAGGVTVNMPEVHIRVKGETVTIEQVEHGPASGMIQEMMLLAGEATAKFAFRQGLAFPYATQEAPEFPPDIPEGLAGSFARVRCMHPKTMSTTPAPHSGLALAMYSQVTSPLRRYSDLVAHQQLRAWLHKQAHEDAPSPLDSSQVLERMLQGDAAAVASVKAERDSNLHWTLVYLMDHPEWTGEAVVVAIRGFQATVIIPALARQTVITTAKRANLNDVVTVKIGKINLPELAFTFIEAKQ